MAITKGWDFSTKSGFTGSAGKVSVSPHTREMAKGGKVQKHYDRMGPKKDVDAMASGGKVGGNWIAKATENKGALHRALKVPEGEKIPAKKLDKAAHSDNPKMRKRAALAETLKGMKKGGKVGKTKLPSNTTQAAGALAKMAALAGPPGAPQGLPPSMPPMGMKKGGKAMKKKC